MLIDGQWRDAKEYQEVRDPCGGSPVSRAPVSTPDDCSDALQAAHRAKKTMAAMPGYARAAMLRRVADEMEKRAESIALAMTRETGKALRDSRVEAQRSCDLMRLCAEEAIRIQGEHVPMDGTAIGAGKLAMVMRFPVGVVAALTPFNSPVNLAVHKIGPALAAGNSVVLKPSPKAPLSVARLVEAFVDADVPPGAINTLYGDAIAPELVKDRRVDFVSFTGSNRVGKLIRDAAGMKRVALELGGVGPTFVHHDANVKEAAKACARHAVGLAGQSCASVQNVFVHKAVYPDQPGVKSGAALCDFMAGIHLYAAIMTALYEREKTGRGRVVEVSMQDATYASLASNLGMLHARGKEAPVRTGNRHGGLGIAPYNVYRTRNGHVVLNAPGDHHFRAILEAMGRPDLKDDPRLQTRTARVVNVQLVDELIENWTKDLDRDDVADRMLAAKVPCAPVRSLSEVMVDRNMHERRSLQWVDHPEMGRVVLMNSPLVFGGTPRHPIEPNRPLGSANDEIYGCWLGRSAEELAALRSEGVIT